MQRVQQREQGVAFACSAPAESARPVASPPTARRSPFSNESLFLGAGMRWGGAQTDKNTRRGMVIGHHHARSWYAPRRARVTSTTGPTRSGTTGSRRRWPRRQGVEDSGHQAEGALRLLRPGSAPLGVTRRARAEHPLGTPQRRNTTTGTPLKVSILNWAPRAQASRNCVTHVSWSVPSLVIYRSLSYDEDDVMVLI